MGSLSTKGAKLWARHKSNNWGREKRREIDVRKLSPEKAVQVRYTRATQKGRNHARDYPERQRGRRPQRDSNPRSCLERALSWAGLDDGVRRKGRSV